MEQMDLRPTVLSAPGVPDHGLLAALGLSAEDLAALARQGCVAAEFRGGLGPYYKLRWRRDERQHVRYLGRDPARADDVRAALNDLRTPRLLARQLTRQMKEARRRLQSVKRMLASQLVGHGLHYHGYAARAGAGRRQKTPSAGNKVE